MNVCDSPIVGILEQLLIISGLMLVASVIAIELYKDRALKGVAATFLGYFYLIFSNKLLKEHKFIVRTIFLMSLVLFAIGWIWVYYLGAENCFS